MKRLLAIILSFTILLCLPGCKGNQEAPTTDTNATNPVIREGKVVGISMPDESWESAARSLQTQLEVLGYQTDLQYAQGDAKIQAQQLVSMAENSVDCIVVAAVDAITLADAANKVASHDIPIIAYDRLLTDTDAVTYYIAPDYYAMGKMVGEYLVQSLSLDTAEEDNKHYTFELFMGNPADANSIMFYDGVLNILHSYISSEVLRNLSKRLDFEDVCIADATAETADSLCSGRISNYYKQAPLDICIAGTDTIAQGVMSSLEYYGYGDDHWPVITGLGYNDAAMFDGKLSMSVFSPTENLVKNCVVLVDAAIFRNPCPLDSEMTTIYNNAASIPTYLCGYQSAEAPEQDAQEHTSPTENAEDPTEAEDSEEDLENILH